MAACVIRLLMRWERSVMTEDELRKRVKLGGSCAYCHSQDITHRIEQGSRPHRTRYSSHCHTCHRWVVWEAPEDEPEPLADDITIIQPELSG